jgi:hypothetical protein
LNLTFVFQEALDSSRQDKLTVSKVDLDGDDCAPVEPEPTVPCPLCE